MDTFRSLCRLFVRRSLVYYERHQTTYFVHLRVRARLYRVASSAIIYYLSTVTVSEDWG